MTASSTEPTPNARALALLAELEALLRQHEGGYAAPDLVREVRQRLQAIKWTGAAPAHDVAYKAGEVEQWAEILFSARRHQQWARGHITGAEYVRRLLGNAIAGLRMVLHSVP